VWVVSSIVARLAVVALVVGACGRERISSNPARLGPVAEPRVEWAGCSVVKKGPRCELESDRKLTIWAMGEGANSWKFSADQRAMRPLDSVWLQNGLQVVFVVPPHTRRVLAVGSDGLEVWSLAVEEPSTGTGIAELVKAGKRGDAQAANRLKEMTSSGDPGFRAVAEAGYGRVMLARGALREAEIAMRAALAADRESGRLSDEMKDGSVLIWALAALGQRFSDARAVLGSLVEARDQFPEGTAWYSYSEGMIAREVGDLRRSLASYRASARVSERLRRVVLGNDLAEDLAQILVTLGRSEEAVTILENLPSKDDPCARASLMINRAEARLEAALGGGAMEESRLLAALAEEQAATAECPDPHRRLLSLADSAWHAIATADGPGADRLVGLLRAESDAKDPLAQAWKADVIGRWNMARRRPRAALESFEEQSAIARAAGLQNERLRAEIGAGEALQALGEHSAAVVRLRAAQTLQQRMFESIPLVEGGGFLTSHAEAVRHLVDALVDVKATDEAMWAARLARVSEARYAARSDRLERLSVEDRRQWDLALEHYTRSRRTIEEEAMEDWRVPRQALGRVRAEREARAEEAWQTLDSAYRLLVDGDGTPSRGPSAVTRDQVEIALFPAAKSWVAFTRTREGVESHRFRDDALDSTETASSVLEMLSKELDRARRVIFLPFGRSDHLDWHAVSWRGAPLVARFEVEYGFDLPKAVTKPVPEDRSSRALLVVNPTEDLQEADKEGDLVARALGASWTITRLDRRAGDRTTVLQLLPNVGLFHYSGHAQAAGSSGGGSTALILAGGARVQLGDLLALPRLPAVVVLSACQAAATAPILTESSTSMVGLAQAFLVAGTHSVVAPTRDVADGDARAFVAKLYETIGRSGGDLSLGSAFRQAAMDSVGRTSQSFRLLVE
jgi:tetratricopeptide (TPR) repeat protein